MQAKALLSEYQQKYNSAKVVYRERKKYVDEIDWNMLAVPPTGSYKAGSHYSPFSCNLKSLHQQVTQLQVNVKSSWISGSVMFKKNVVRVLSVMFQFWYCFCLRYIRSNQSIKRSPYERVITLLCACIIICIHKEYV